MTIYADFLANTKSLDITAPIQAGDRSIQQWMEDQVAKGDVAYLAAYAAKDEVQSIAQHVPTVSGGTFALTILLRNGETFTTAGIAFAANAATIEGAIDTAATALPVTGWTNGDISVAGGDLNSAPVTLTFDGTSVDAENHALTVIDGALLTGGGSAGAVTTTTNGQTKRTSWAILAAVGAVTAGIPYQGVTISQYDLTVAYRDANPAMPSAAILQTLAEEAGIEDLNATVVTAIKDALRLVQ